MAAGAKQARRPRNGVPGLHGDVGEAPTAQGGRSPFVGAPVRLVMGEPGAEYVGHVADERIDAGARAALVAGGLHCGQVHPFRHDLGADAGTEAAARIDVATGAPRSPGKPWLVCSSIRAGRPPAPSPKAEPRP